MKIHHKQIQRIPISQSAVTRLSIFMSFTSRIVISLYRINLKNMNWKASAAVASAVAAVLNCSCGIHYCMRFEVVILVTEKSKTNTLFDQWISTGKQVIYDFENLVRRSVGVRVVEHGSSGRTDKKIECVFIKKKKNTNINISIVCRKRWRS